MGLGEDLVRTRVDRAHTQSTRAQQVVEDPFVILPLERAATQLAHELPQEVSIVTLAGETKQLSGLRGLQHATNLTVTRLDLIGLQAHVDADARRHDHPKWICPASTLAISPPLMMTLSAAM